MKVLLVRHGMTQGNKDRRYVGRRDEPILEASYQTLKENGCKIFCEKEALCFSPEAPFAAELLFVSPLLRCRQTAQALFGDMPQRVCDGLMETDFGEFSQKTYEELKEDPAYREWIKSGGLSTPTGGESGVDFRKRAISAFEECVRVGRTVGAGNIAVVTHGGVIMSVMSAYGVPAGMFHEWLVKNGEGYLLEL